MMFLSNYLFVCSCFNRLFFSESERGTLSASVVLVVSILEVLKMIIWLVGGAGMVHFYFAPPLSVARDAT